MVPWWIAEGVRYRSCTVVVGSYRHVAYKALAWLFSGKYVYALTLHHCSAGIYWRWTAVIAVPGRVTKLFYASFESMGYLAHRHIDIISETESTYRVHLVWFNDAGVVTSLFPLLLVVQRSCMHSRKRSGRWRGNDTKPALHQVDGCDQIPKFPALHPGCVQRDPRRCLPVPCPALHRQRSCFSDDKRTSSKGRHPHARSRLKIYYL